MLTSGGFLDGDICKWAGCIQTYHSRFFCFLDSNVIIDLLLTLEKLFGTLKTLLGRLYREISNIVKQVFRVNYANKEDCTHLARLIEEAFVVFFLLKDIKSVFTTVHSLSHILHFVFSLLLIIWWIRCRIVPYVCIVERRLTVFGIAVLKADSIET